jgi:hypothetical protein
MIPMLATFRYSNPRRRFTLYGIPLFLVWLLILPFAILGLPIVFIGCLALKINPFRMISGVWNVLTALRGTHVEFADGQDSVLLHLS